tara:strand:+ start:806 stop:916 length:111 start_codon:yes stop_codon:yes gene_type:complete
MLEVILDLGAVPNASTIGILDVGILGFGRGRAQWNM